MRTIIINTEVAIDIQEVYDSLETREQRSFLLDNIQDLKTEDLIEELKNRNISIHINE